MPAKKPRPPTLSLETSRKPVTATVIEFQTPIDLYPQDSQLDAHSSSPLSSPSSSGSPSPIGYALNNDTDSDLYADTDEISRDLAVLEKLGRNVRKNLRLRPIRSAAPPSAARSQQHTKLPSSHSSDSPTTSTSDIPDHRSPSPDTSISSPISAYFTPLTEFRPTPISARYPDFAHQRDKPSRDITPLSTSVLSSQHHNHHPPPPLSASSRGISPALLLSRLSAPTRPLLVDTRPVGAFLASRLQHSINIAIPSLILKRSKKQPHGAFQLDSLRQFVTTEQGKQAWDDLMLNQDWDGDVIVFDEYMNEKDRPFANSHPSSVTQQQQHRHHSAASSSSSAAWSIMDLIGPLLRYGTVDYLEGGLAAARQHPYLSQLILSRSDSDDTYEYSSHNPDHLILSAPGTSSSAPPPKSSTNPRSSTANSSSISAAPKKPASGLAFKGLSQLDTLTAARSKTFPLVEQQLPSPPDRQPMQVQSWNILEDYAPSPPPSSTVFSCRSQAIGPLRRPSIPALRKLDTTSAERLNGQALPKLQVRPPSKAQSLTLPKHGNSSQSSLRSRSKSPSHLNLVVSTHSSPPHSARLLSPRHNPNASDSSSSNTLLLQPPKSPSAPHTPLTPSTPLPPSPSTARPEPDSAAPPTTEEAFPTFTVSTILPNFLFLGPEPTTDEHVQELLDLGVKRILNLAIECDDSNGLGLREKFERYARIPMRDTVEEDNITRGVREACSILDDARLHSAPTYVHCKAGKSRSVTAVMAYLIHANHWTLSRAYAFVVGRRKGISPNIGFVSELMTFEETELGGKSVGVVKMPPPHSASSSGPTGGNPLLGGTGEGAEDGEGAGVGGAGAAGGGKGMYPSYQVALSSSRRGQHVRESLPPAFTLPPSLSQSTASGLGGQGGGEGGGMSTAIDAVDVALVGDAQQEMEIRDKEGRYRHARRAPVDEATLQPMRRVSKAGLESAGVLEGF